MTEDQSPSSFKIKMDSEPEESPFLEDLREKRMEKLGQRITLASILIPCVIGAALIAGYMDLKGRVAGLKSVGAQQNQNISDSLESKFSALSIKQSALEEASAKNIVSFQSALAGIKDRLAKQQKLLDQTTASKADRKEMTQIQADLDKSIADLNAAVKQLEASRITQLSAQISKISEELKASQEQIAEMEGVVAELSKNQVDRKQLAAQLAASEKKILESVSQIKSNLNSEISALEKRIDKITAPSSASEKKSVSPQRVPSDGTIIEEDLRQ